MEPATERRHRHLGVEVIGYGDAHKVQVELIHLSPVGEDPLRAELRRELLRFGPIQVTDRDEVDLRVPRICLHVVPAHAGADDCGSELVCHASLPPTYDQSGTKHRLRDHCFARVFVGGRRYSSG